MKACGIHAATGWCSDCRPCKNEHPAKPGVFCTRAWGHPSNCMSPESHSWHMPGKEPAAPVDRSARISFLERKREATKADLLMKFEDDDFHGVADAAMDLRDIESELKGLSL